MRESLSLDDPLALMLVLARAGVGGECRLLGLLELQKQRLVSAVAEQQQDERLGADGPDADDLACEVAEVGAPQDLAPVRSKGLLVERDRVAKLFEDGRVPLDRIADDHRVDGSDPVLPVDLLAHA